MKASKNGCKAASRLQSHLTLKVRKVNATKTSKKCALNLSWRLFKAQQTKNIFLDVTEDFQEEKKIVRTNPIVLFLLLLQSYQMQIVNSFQNKYNRIHMILCTKQYFKNNFQFDFAWGGFFFFFILNPLYPLGYFLKKALFF